MVFSFCCRFQTSWSSSSQKMPVSIARLLVGELGLQRHTPSPAFDLSSTQKSKHSCPLSYPAPTPIVSILQTQKARLKKVKHLTMMSRLKLLNSTSAAFLVAIIQKQIQLLRKITTPCSDSPLVFQVGELTGIQSPQLVCRDL